MNKNLETFYEELFRYNRTYSGVKEVSLDGVTWMSLESGLAKLADSNELVLAYFDEEK